MLLMPTKTKWEDTARGGLAGKRCPRGSPAPDGSQCNFADKNADAVLRQLDRNINWAGMGAGGGHGACAPVGAYTYQLYLQILIKNLLHGVYAI